MKGKKICIDQALHGYSKGHRLLCASQKMSDSDAKKMTMLSDLSGNEFVKGFEEYYTGYRLSNDKIVLACTWYANEMSRPGCVWTHSLIIELKELRNCNRDVSEIFSLFRKPSSDNDLGYYEQKIEFHEGKEIELNEEKLKYIIWCIWGNEMPSVIFAENSFIYQNELIYLFLIQNDLLETDFSFCTGSVSLRSYDNQPLKLQIAPRKVSRSRMFIGEKAYEIRDEKMIRSYPIWVNKVYDNIILDDLKDFKKFRKGFSAQYKKAENFSSLVKLYVASNADRKETSLVRLLEMACVIFEDRKAVCQEILSLNKSNYFKNWIGEEECVETIKFFLDNTWLDQSLFNIQEWVIKGFNSDYLETKNLFKNIIYMDDNYLVEKILKVYADILPQSKFADFTDLEYDGCSTLIILNPRFAVCPELWKQSLGYQQGIINCLKMAGKEDVSIIEEIVGTILEISQNDLVINLYKAYGKDCLKEFWEYLLLNKKDNKMVSIKNIVKNDIHGGIKNIKKNLEDRKRLLLLIDCVDSYNPEIKELRENDITKLFSTVISLDCNKEEREMLAEFLIPICIMADYTVPLYIAEFSFHIVNNLLATQSFPEREWEKLEKILPEVAFYNSWDRCKRLRKGFKKRGFLFKGIKEEDMPVHLL